MTRIASYCLALGASALLSACVFAPPVTTPTDTNAVAKMSEQALATCGAGNVKEVNAKSFTCK
ncbi:hypothetical protein J2X20_003725 [Pelomonas saccharophila]|uniref:Uncharacterized protein n=1 Tax=Roseateles saccharophilus TaxID=304 RepID=A0ABU1YQC8_ROSSA|nr:hypothetical protein [Roseateles saccharophilus]MDR7271067.1 hypothetical protein [Roseateles saccharophilus]